MPVRRLIQRALTRHRAPPRTPDAPPPVPEPWQSPDLDLSGTLMDCLHPHLLGAIHRDNLVGLATDLGFGLWSLPVFSEDGCRRIAHVINDRLEWQQAHPQQSPNSMHYAGVVFEPMGMAAAVSELRSVIVEPLRTAMFPEIGPLDSDYAFAATYGPGLDRGLGFHVDDSEITLNVSLDGGYTGGEIVFQGRRCAIHRQEAHRREEEFAYTIPPGHGVLHAGNHRHLVNTVRGSRRNMIVWCRSAQTRSAANPGACAPWCGHKPRT